MGAGAILRGLTQAGTAARLGHVQGQQDAEAQRQAQLAKEAEEAERLQQQLRQDALLKFQLDAPTRQRESFDYEQGVTQQNRLDEIAARAQEERKTASMRPRSSGSDPYGGRSRDQWITDLAAESKAKGSGKSSGRALPSSAVEKLVGLDNLIGQAEDVISATEQAMEKGVDVTGRALGGLVQEPGWLMNRRRKGGDEGAQVRSLIGNLFSTLAKERGGSALSDAEIAILQSFVPNKDDDEPDVIIKAKQFIHEMKRMKANKEANYAKYGYGSPAGEAAPDEDMSDADLYEELRNQGMSHEAAVAQVEARRG